MYIKQLPSGTWRVIVQANGGKKTGTAPTYTKAQILGAQLLIDLGGKQPLPSVTVGEMVDQWLDETKPAHSLTYHTDVASALRNVPETFRQRIVSEVTVPIVDALYRTLGAGGLSAHRVRRVHGGLSAGWQMAQRLGWATWNPCSAAKLPELAGRDVHPPDAETVNKLLTGLVKRPKLHLFYRLAVTTGARRGELVALQWDDIGPNSILIRRSLGQVPGEEIEVRGTKTGTKGHRAIAVGADILAALALEKERQQSKIDKGVVKATPKWVFSHTAGQTPWRPDNPSKEFRRLCKRLGITGVRLHDGRHFVATQLLSSGAAPSTVAHRLGHSTVATTLRTYAHYVQATDQASASLMENLTAG